MTDPQKLLEELEEKVGVFHKLLKPFRRGSNLTSEEKLAQFHQSIDEASELPGEAHEYLGVKEPSTIRPFFPAIVGIPILGFGAYLLGQDPSFTKAMLVSGAAVIEAGAILYPASGYNS